jgi:hypothetical protein
MSHTGASTCGRHTSHSGAHTQKKHPRRHSYAQPSTHSIPEKPKTMGLGDRIGRKFIAAGLVCTDPGCGGPASVL